jgi:hypothetical protein
MSNASEEAVTEVMVLAAIDRAQRHSGRPDPAVMAGEMLKHLQIASRTRRARHVRDQLEVMEATGLLERSRRHGIEVWALTSTGRRRLARARRAGEVPVLPESPQHRKWRQARTAAGEEIERFRKNLRDDLNQARSLLDADQPPHSEAWFELAARLQRGCRQLGAASHCLYEWREPDDETADIDDHQEPGDEQLPEDERARARYRRTGRRNIRRGQDC